MANTSIGTYEVRLTIPQFSGLMQDGDGVNVDAQYAREVHGVDTTGGVLRTAAKCRPLPAELPSPIGTLARLHRRWHASQDARDVLVAASAGQLYWMLPEDDTWTRMAMPEGMTAYQTDTWSWVTYEINPEGSDAPVDVLLLSSAKDGMVCVRGDDMTVSIVPTPKKFGVISRYAERIWGGAIDDDPDMLVYSAPFDPFNWEQNNEFPEDGAGDIAQPSWDGDSFTALVPFGSQLLAFKKYRVWRILGTDPGQYIFKEQYGGGAKFFDTLATVGSDVLMLGTEGLQRYNGMTVEPYYPQYARQVFARMNQDALNGTSGCLYKERYYCALPLDGSAINNAVLVMDSAERTWLLRTDVTVRDFLPTDGGLFYTSATEPGRVYRWGEDPWTDGAVPLRWVSPWMDYQRKDCKYGGWTVRLDVVCQKPVDLTVTIQTEKKKKTKTYKALPPPQGRAFAKPKRLSFGGSGRRWRFIIESPEGPPWELSGGLMITAERDED